MDADGIVTESGKDAGNAGKLAVIEGTCRDDCQDCFGPHLTKLRWRGISRR